MQEEILSLAINSFLPATPSTINDLFQVICAYNEYISNELNNTIVIYPEVQPNTNLDEIDGSIDRDINKPEIISGQTPCLTINFSPEKD